MTRSDTPSVGILASNTIALPAPSPYYRCVTGKEYQISRTTRGASSMFEAFMRTGVHTAATGVSVVVVSIVDRIG